jgi:hypothetical protein
MKNQIRVKDIKKGHSELRRKDTIIYCAFFDVIPYTLRRRYVKRMIVNAAPAPPPNNVAAPMNPDN